MHDLMTTKQIDPENPGRYSSSLVAGLAMLACFTAGRPTQGIAEMAAELDLGRSTTHRYATTLVALGYLEQGPSRKYRLSSQVSNIGLSLLDSMTIRRVAHNYVEELRARTGHTASLGILWGSEVTYIDRCLGSRQGQYEIDQGIGLGTSLPLHCTAAGKALLASLPVVAQRELIASLRLRKHGPKTITTKSALHTQLEEIEAGGGIALDNEETLAGRKAIAAPIIDNNAPAAAIELAIPSQACTDHDLTVKLVPKIKAMAYRVSSALAHLDT